MKPTLVLLGDSFTAGDGSNSETVIPQLFDADWREFADRHSLAYFKNIEDEKWANNFGIIQQQYLEAYNTSVHTETINHKHRWSSIVAQHTGFDVINYAKSGNSINGIAYTLAMWLNDNPQPSGPVCVVANFTHINRHSFVSRDTENYDELLRDSPYDLLVTHNAHDGVMDNYFAKYDQMKGYEFEYYYTIWLCEQLCHRHSIKFVWSGPYNPPDYDFDQCNYFNFSVNNNNRLSNIIPEYTDIISYHRFCNSETKQNPLSPCGHFNQLGQQTMGREFSRKLLENEDWLFKK